MESMGEDMFHGVCGCVDCGSLEGKGSSILQPIFDKPFEHACSNHY